MSQNYVVKTRAFVPSKFSGNLELTEVQYSVMQGTESEVLLACQKSQTQLVTHQMMGPISKKESDIILQGKNEDLIREIALRAKEKFNKQLEEAPF